MRAILKLTVNLGRVPIPVGLAVTRRDGDPQFRTVHRECGTPVEQRRFCPYDDRLVERDELAKAWEVTPGEYLLVEEEELEALAPDPGRGVELVATIDWLELNPLLVDRAYYLVPVEQRAAQRGYGLLRDALAEEHALALGRFVGWQRERLAAIAPNDHAAGALVLWTLTFPDDLVPWEPIVEPAAGADELEAARDLVARMRVPLRKVDLAPRHRPLVTELLASKLAGQPLVRLDRPRPAPPAQPPADITRALRQSIRDLGPRRARRAKTPA